MTTPVIPKQCAKCARLFAVDPVIGKRQPCLAFKAGIPDAMYQGKANHLDPLPGDGGIQFEPVKR